MSCCYLPADDERVWLSTARAHLSRMTSRHVRRRGAPRSRHVTRPAPTDVVLRDDAKRVVRPRRQRDAEVSHVATDVRPRRPPDIRTPRRVVLNDEPTNWRIVLTEQFPVKLNYSSVAHRPVNIDRCVWNVCSRRLNSFVYSS